jgi:hypothetical protein
MPDSILVAVVLGYVGSMWLSALTWKRSKAFRILPLIYGALVAFPVFYAYRQPEQFIDALSAVLGFVALGALFSSCAWLEMRFGK